MLRLNWLGSLLVRSCSSSRPSLILLSNWISFQWRGHILFLNLKMMARFLVMALKILICTENGVAFFTHHNLLVAAIDAVLCELALLWELLTAGNTRKYPLRLLWFRLLLLLD